VSPNLKSYEREVWHLISQFQDFNIIYVPRIHNVVVDKLENVIARLSLLRDGFSIEIIYSPFVSDNIINFQVFNDHQ